MKQIRQNYNNYLQPCTTTPSAADISVVVVVVVVVVVIVIIILHGHVLIFKFPISVRLSHGRMTGGAKGDKPMILELNA